MNAALTLMSRFRALVGGHSAPSSRTSSSPRTEAGLEASTILAQCLTLDAWIDDGPEGDASGERRVTIRAIHGYRGGDGLAVPMRLRGWCHREDGLRLIDVARIRGLRASQFGAVLHRPADIGMWLRVEAGLIHARDVERLNTLRRRAQDEAEAAQPEPTTRRIWVRPVSVRIETMRDDEPLARRIEDLMMLSWEAGPDGMPSVIYVAKDADARRGRPVSIAPCDTAPNRLLSLQAPPGGAHVLDVPRWVAGLPRRGPD